MVIEVVVLAAVAGTLPGLVVQDRRPGIWKRDYLTGDLEEVAALVVLDFASIEEVVWEQQRKNFVCLMN